MPASDSDRQVRSNLLRPGVLWVLLIAMPGLTLAQDSPEDLARRVADRIVMETVFDFKPALPHGNQEGFYAIDFFDSLTEMIGGQYFARSILVVDSTSSDDLAIGLSHSPGSVRISLGDEVMYEGQSAQEPTLRHLDYALVRPNLSIPLHVSPGEHRLSVKFIPAGPEAVVFIGLIHLGSELAFEHARLEAPAIADALDAIRFLLVGPFAPNTLGIDSIVGPDTTWLDLSVDYLGANDRPIRWDVPRVHLVRDHPEKLDYSDWRYFSGTFLDAMNTVTRHFDDLDYGEYINRHMDFFLTHRDLIARERETYHLIESAFGHYFRFSLLDDMAMQTVPFANRLLAVPPSRRGSDTPDLLLVRRVVDYIFSKARRLPDGTFARLNPDSLTVWADDMFMGSVILSRASELYDDGKYIHEAARQALLIHEHLVDRESGLYWHGWFERTQKHSSSKWGRANGWTMMAKTELLLNLDRGDPDFDAVLAIFQSHAAALLRVQSEDGRWHQVLDNPDTYLETSATAMFVRAFAEGIRNGWLPKENYLEAVRKGWTALSRQVRDDGFVEGIVRGTPIFYSDDEYNEHPTRLNDPRGLGAVLYAAVSVDRMNRWLAETN